MSNKELVLSPLGHTWLFDIDGTIVKHNGYKIDGHDTLLPGVEDFFRKIPKEDKIIFITSRASEYAYETEKFLKMNEIRFDMIVYDLPYGERILVNDDKPSGLKTSYCIDLFRNEGIEGLRLSIDGTL